MAGLARLAGLRVVSSFTQLTCNKARHSREEFNKKNYRTICVADHFTGFYMLQFLLKGISERRHMS